MSSDHKKNEKRFSLAVWSKDKKKLHEDMEATRSSIFLPEKESSFSKKQLAIKISLICAIAGAVYFDHWLLSTKPCPSYINIQKRMPESNKFFRRLENYIHFIVSTVRRKGAKGIDSKWEKDIPPSFKKNAASKLQLMCDEGYIVDKISERDTIYTVRCHALAENKDIIFIDVIKKKFGEKSLFRLLRIY